MKIWHKVDNPAKIDKGTLWVSNAVGRSEISEGGSVIPCPDILFRALHLFQPSRIHLSSAGLHGLFLKWKDGELSQGYPPMAE